MQKNSSEKYLRDPSVKFEQECEITILSKYKSHTFEKFTSEIEFNKNQTRVYLIIKKGSELKYNDALYNDLLEYIIQEKLKSNVMVNLFEAEYEEIIRQYVDIIEKIKILTFKEDKKILISQGLDEEKSFKANLNMTIEDNYSNDVNPDDGNAKIDYADRNFLLSCNVGEELFEFIKPKQGKNGRNCKGNLIEVETIDLEAKPIFTVDDNIEVEDSFENIKYLSSKSGYLIKKENKYEVSNSIDIDEISFKTTGTIDSDLDREITINVIKDDPLEDAIEEGMHVKVQNLFITGSIGPNTEVEARNVSISGQTHHNSIIKCMKAEIGVHKGEITGREIAVKTLEGGEIIADIAIVQNAMSGKITAKRIEIHTLGSHIIMHASQYIKIEKVRGEENRFIFESSAESGLDSNKVDSKNYLEKLEKELDDLKEILKISTAKLKKNLEQCKKIKASIIKNKMKGIQTSATLIKNFKVCKVMQIRYKKTKESFEYAKEQYIKEETNHSNNSTNILDAQITTNEALRGFNSIVYKLEKSDVKIELKTNESMKEKVFKVVENSDGVLEVVNSK